MLQLSSVWFVLDFNTVLLQELNTVDDNANSSYKDSYKDTISFFETIPFLYDADNTGI